MPPYGSHGVAEVWTFTKLNLSNKAEKLILLFEVKLQNHSPAKIDIALVNFSNIHPVFGDIQDVIDAGSAIFIFWIY